MSSVEKVYEAVGHTCPPEELLRKDLELAYCGNLNLREVTIAQIQTAYASFQVSAVDITNAYLKRIEALNPHLNAVIEVNPDALSIAKELDDERIESGVRGPLHGIPILIKDNIGTADKMETCAGALALRGLKPKRDSEVVKRLREAGAIILGKANLSEFANYRDPGIPDGWSGCGGPTHNAYICSKTPMGSSSGSTVAVAANLAVATLGSETDGSLIAPSSVASVVGLKPTVGAVSGVGVIPLCPSQDSVGPVARTVADVALLYNAITTKPIDTKCFDVRHPDIHCCLQKKLKIGALRMPCWIMLEENAEINVKLQSALEALQLCGVIVEDPVEIEEQLITDVSSEAEDLILNCEFRSDLNKYLQNDVTAVEDSCGNYNKVRSLADVIQFNKDHPGPENYGQSHLEAAEASGGTENPEYAEARDKNKAAARKFIDTVLEKYDLDAIVGPSDSCGRHFCAVAGYPIISVPAGFNNGIPFGISFFGTAGSEENLLLLAFRFESVFKGRQTSLFKK